MTELTGHGPEGETGSDMDAASDMDRADAAPVGVRRLACRTVATSRLRQRHHIRDLEPFGSGAGSVDPSASESLLGGDEEPHPSEMLLAALGACLTVSLQANAVARGIPLRRLEVHVGGDVEASALWVTGQRRPRPLGFESIGVDVLIEADASAEALKLLVDHAVLWSPVANTLHDPVEFQVTLRSP